MQRSKHSPSPSALIVFIWSSFSSKDDSGSITDIRSLDIHSFKTGFQYISFKVEFSGKIFAVTFIFKLFSFNLVEPSAISSIFLDGIKSFSGLIVLSGDIPLHILFSYLNDIFGKSLLAAVISKDEVSF